MASLIDIRIGTVLPIHDAPVMVPRVLELNFESVQLTAGRNRPAADFQDLAKQVTDCLGDRAIVSSIGFFANVIEDPSAADVFAKYIDQAHLFGTKLVVGFTGALDGQPVPESIPRFKRCWGDLGKRAADKGVRIAFENCEMAGSWKSARMNLAHSPAFWELMWNELPPEQFGLCWEPCHQLLSLVDPIPQLRKLASAKRIFNVHGKDARIAWDVVREYGIRSGREFVWQHHPGFGESNWTDIVTILRMNGYVGSIDIEGYHDAAYKGDLEWPGQVHALNYLKQCRGGTRMVSIDV